MIVDKSRSLTNDVEIERLLRDYAEGDLFGSAPNNLIQKALDSLVSLDSAVEPCDERRPHAQLARSTALIVLSLAAAGLFAAALPRSSGWNRNSGNTETSVVRPTALAAARLQSNNPSVALADQSHTLVGTPESDVVHSSMIDQVSVRPLRRRSPISTYQPAQHAIWTTTVVSETEQAIVLPVVSTASNNENELNGQSQTGVAVVPLQSSGLTYTEYTGGGSQ